MNKHEELEQFLEMMESDLEFAESNGFKPLVVLLTNYIKDLKEIIE